MWFNGAHQSLIKAVHSRKVTCKHLRIPNDGCDTNRPATGVHAPTPSLALAMPYTFYKHFDS